MNETELPSIKQSVFLVFNRQIIPLDKQITRLGRQLDNDIVFNEELFPGFMPRSDWKMVYMYCMITNQHRGLL